MPAAIPAIIAATGTFIATESIALAVVSFALAVGSSLLAPEPPSIDTSSLQKQGLTTQFRRALAPREYVYGDVRKSGAVSFIASSGEDNKYLHIMINVADHEIEAIDEYLINDDSIPLDALDGDGNVISGTYEGKMRIRARLGSDAQTADPDLITEVSGLDSNFRARGVAQIYIRIEWDRELFPSGIPAVSCFMRGKKVLDTRDSVTRFNMNSALQAYDFLTDDTYGLGAAVADTDTTTIDATANLCDEIVDARERDYSFTGADDSTDIISMSGDILEMQRGDRVQLVSGTLGGISNGVDYYVIPYQRIDDPRIKLASTLANAIAGTADIDVTSDGSGTFRVTGEPRYHGGGVLGTDTSPRRNFQDMLSAFGGTIVKTGGNWFMRGFEYFTPTISFDENDIIDAVSIRPKFPKDERFNQIQGAYKNPVNKSAPTDYPLVRSQTYVDQDGQELKRTLDLPFTQRGNGAQRIAKIFLERSRQEIVVEAIFKLTAFTVQPADNIFLTLEKYGFENKVFEVKEWELLPIGDAQAPAWGIRLALQENAAAVYEFDSATEEQLFDPAPNTTLPSIRNVQTVTGFALDSVLIETQGGDKTFNVVASWNAPTDEFITQGGRFEIEYKRSSETDYKKFPVNDGQATETILPNLQPDIAYDIRIRAFNNLGVPSSAYSTITGFVVGSTATTTTEDWENESGTSRDGQDWENDTGASEDWEA